MGTLEQCIKAAPSYEIEKSQNRELIEVFKTLQTPKIELFAKSSIVNI